MPTDVIECHSPARRGSGKVAGIAFALAFGLSNGALGQALFDESVRADMLKHRDGRIAHVETEYNDIFVNKNTPFLSMFTRVKTASYVKSAVNLKDPGELPMAYAQVLPASLLYPATLKRVLMIGLGAGLVSTYLGQSMPDVQIDVVEIDPEIVSVAKKYFGLQETEKVHFAESDGRVYLNRHKDQYDLIVLDAYRDVGVPFHLLTKEFYGIVKDHLAPGGTVVSNLYGGTKLYTSTVVTLRAVFPTVDLYPVWEIGDERQVILVASPSTAPTVDALTQRATVLQDQYRFRYPLPPLVSKRVANADIAAPGGELLTDDFAPVGLYEMTPVKARKR